MNEQSEKTHWVYVAVVDPGANEKFMGMHDDKNDISYIPAFDSKEDAHACLINLPRTPGKKYEVQAVMFEELAEDARENGFHIFMIDAEGRIQKQIKP